MAAESDDGRDAGFTLLEVIVVVLLVAVLASVMVAVVAVILRNAPSTEANATIRAPTSVCDLAARVMSHPHRPPGFDFSGGSTIAPARTVGASLVQLIVDSERRSEHDVRRRLSLESRAATGAKVDPLHVRPARRALRRTRASDALDVTEHRQTRPSDTDCQRDRRHNPPDHVWQLRSCNVGRADHHRRSRIAKSVRHAAMTDLSIDVRHDSTRGMRERSCSLSSPSRSCCRSSCSRLRTSWRPICATPRSSMPTRNAQLRRERYRLRRRPAAPSNQTLCATDAAAGSPSASTVPTQRVRRCFAWIAPCHSR